jgi:hypothetical protein
MALMTARITAVKTLAGFGSRPGQAARWGTGFKG